MVTLALSINMQVPQGEGTIHDALKAGYLPEIIPESTLKPRDRERKMKIDREGKNLATVGFEPTSSSSCMWAVSLARPAFGPYTDKELVLWGEEMLNHCTTSPVFLPSHLSLHILMYGSWI